MRERITQMQKTVYNPDRGAHDKTMCDKGVTMHKGFLGPWLP
jgi:hypothetical protein